MHTIFLSGADYQTARELHGALKRLLGLPDHYGHNADALYDCLSERREKVNLVVLGEGNPDVAGAIRKCAAVVSDLGGQVSGI